MFVVSLTPGGGCASQRCCWLHADTRHSHATRQARKKQTEHLRTVDASTDIGCAHARTHARTHRHGLVDCERQRMCGWAGGRLDKLRSGRPSRLLSAAARRGEARRPAADRRRETKKTGRRRSRYFDAEHRQLWPAVPGGLLACRSSCLWRASVCAPACRVADRQWQRSSVDHRMAGVRAIMGRLMRPAPARWGLLGNRCRCGRRRLPTSARLIKKKKEAQRKTPAKQTDKRRPCRTP